MEESTGAKYPIYDVTDSAGRVHSIHTAAQFGDRAYIVSALEKSLDADVNGLVHLSPLSIYTYIIGIQQRVSSAGKGSLGAGFRCCSSLGPCLACYSLARCLGLCDLVQFSVRTFVRISASFLKCNIDCTGQRGKDSFALGHGKWKERSCAHTA